MTSIKKLLDGSGVLRWHTHRMQRPQTVAEHSCRAALILMAILPDCRIELLRAVLTHDLAEVSTGDVPAQVKWKHPKLDAMLKDLEYQFEYEHGIYEELSEEEQKILKWVDKVELLSWCAEEAKLGNTYALEPYDKVYKIVVQMGFPTPDAQRVFKEIAI